MSDRTPEPVLRVDVLDADRSVGIDTVWAASSRSREMIELEGPAGNVRYVIVSDSVASHPPIVPRCSATPWIGLSLMTHHLDASRTARHGRWVDGRYHRDKVADACEVSHALLPEVSAQGGYCGVLVAVDIESGVTFSVSLWDREQSSESNVMSGWFQEQVARFERIYVEAPDRAGFGVSAARVHEGHPVPTIPRLDIRPARS